MTPPRHDNGTKVTFNIQTHLFEMEERLGKRIDEVKNHCPNDLRIASVESKAAKTDGLVKWFASLSVGGFVAMIAALLNHIFNGGGKP